MHPKFTFGYYRRGNTNNNNRMIDFNSVQNSRDCRADKSQIARSRIGPLQNAKQALFFVSNFRMFCFDQ